MSGHSEARNGWEDTFTQPKLCPSSPGHSPNIGAVPSPIDIDKLQFSAQDVSKLPRHHMSSLAALGSTKAQYSKILAGRKPAFRKSAPSLVPS